MTVSATATYDEVTVSLWPNAALRRGHVGIGVDTDDTHGYYPYPSEQPHLFIGMSL